ncbi:hypothetical protein ACQKMD_06995 [Viridibacillus sp. NPDC096237]|uniref:hypothetical protein n=1 Tax=Viridibacillus sp. NPDC096237 TaxID=3390721 RepID=UPI003D02C4CF
MEGKFYTVKHRILEMNYDVPYVSSGKSVDTWIWDVYIVDKKDSILVRMECTTSGKNVAIPWYEVRNIKLEDAIIDACRFEMQKAIKSIKF